MRQLLLLETYTSDNLSGISVWNQAHALLQGLQRLGRPHFCEWLVPSRRGSLTWPADYFARPWIEPLPLLDDRTASFDHPPVAACTLEPILPKRGKVVFDYVLNQKFLHSAAIKLALTVPPGRWWQQVEVPVVTYLTETSLDKRLPMLRERCGRILLCAAAACGAVFVHQECDRQELLETWESFMGSGEPEVYVVPPVADFSRIDELAKDHFAARDQRRRAGAPLSIFHGGSLEGKRHLEGAAKAVAELRNEGVAATLVLTTQWKTSRNPLERYGAQLYAGVGHEDYVRALGLGDVLLCAAEYEGTGLAYMEAVWSGQLPVVLKAPWMMGRLPADYPFVSDDWCQWKEHVAELARNYERHAEVWRPRLRRALQPFEPLVAAGLFDDAVRLVMEPVTQRNLAMARKQRPAFSLLEQVVAEEQWVEVPPAAEVYMKLSAASATGADFRYVSPLALRWMLMALGYRDVCDQATPRLVKEEP